MIDVIRIAKDGLSRERWSFSPGERSGEAILRLSRYQIERRPQARGAFRKAASRDRWDHIDERQYFSGLERPKSIPRDVLEEARDGLVERLVFLVKNEEHRL